MSKTTLILGASTNPSRYAYLAAERLKQHKIKFELLGNKTGEVFNETIKTDQNEVSKDIDTVTVYLGADNQKTYESFLLGLKPKRVIFNPGAENPALALKLATVGIETIEACTLVMLGTGQY